jgi:hypothetical protein
VGVGASVGPGLFRSRANYAPPDPGRHDMVQHAGQFQAKRRARARDPSPSNRAAQSLLTTDAPTPMAGHQIVTSLSPLTSWKLPDSTLSKR